MLPYIVEEIQWILCYYTLVNNTSSFFMEKILLSNNRKASYEYFIEDTYEAGIVLTGSEVKSLRKVKPSIDGSYAAFDGGDIYVYNLHISEYSEANRFNHYPKRPKKLLLHLKELRRLIGLIKRKGITLIPLRLYFNNKNLVKLLIAVSRGKKKTDKREAIKQREWERNKNRLEGLV